MGTFTENRLRVATLVANPPNDYRDTVACIIVPNNIYHQELRISYTYLPICKDIAPVHIAVPKPKPIIKPTVKNPGHIYLVQSASMKEDCFKSGMSGGKSKSRVKSYGSDRIEHFCIYVNQVNKCEAKIIKKFTSKFKLVQGREYFQGNKEEVLNLFKEIVDTHIEKYGAIDIDDSSDEETEEGV